MYLYFHMIDENGDEEIDESELENAVTSLINVIINFFTEDILNDTTFSNLDTDDDGKITEEGKLVSSADLSIQMNLRKLTVRAFCFNSSFKT